MTKVKAGPPPPPPVEKDPDRSPEGLRATADRIDQRKDSGFFVPGSAAGVYAEAMRALAREREVAEMKRLRGRGGRAQLRQSMGSRYQSESSAIAQNSHEPSSSTGTVKTPRGPFHHSAVFSFVSP